MNKTTCNSIGRLSLCAAVVSAILLGAGAVLAVEGEIKIGVTSGVKPDARGYPPLSPMRVLKLGLDVHGEERVVTTEGGLAHMLFLDGSSLTVGQNSQIVLDSFIYDPETETGELALSATKGLFRLVGGKISKKNPVIIRAGAAVIGIRGGIALVEIGSAGPAGTGIAVNATLLFGESLTVETPAGRSEANRPGFSIRLQSDDQAPAAPVPANTEDLNVALSSLETDDGGDDDDGSSGAADAGDEGRGDDGGGDVAQVTDEDMEESGVSEVGSDSDPGAMEAPDADTRAGADDGAGADVAEEPEETDRVTDASQDTSRDVIIETRTRLAGRVKAGGADRGTDDTDPGSNLPVNEVSVGDGVLEITLPDGVLTLPFEPPPGEEFIAFLDPNDPIDTPFGPAIGAVFRAENDAFAFFGLATVDNLDERIIGFVGKVAEDIPTSGYTLFEFAGFDFVLGSDLPFVPGDTLYGDSPEATTLLDDFLDQGPDTGTGNDLAFGGAAILWDSSGGTFGGFAATISGAGRNQVSGITLMTGDVLNDAEGRPYISGFHRGSVRPDDGLSPHVLYGDIATSDDGTGNDFFGETTPEFFILESARLLPGEGDTNDPDYAGSFDQNFEGDPNRFFGNTLFIPYEDEDDEMEDELSTRTAHTLHGFVGGTRQSIDGTTGEILSSRAVENGNNNSPLAVVIETRPNDNRLSATFIYGDVEGGSAVTANFGDTGASGGRSAFLDDESFGAIESSDSASDGQLYMITMDLGELYYNSPEFVGAGGFDGGNLPEYDFVTWGFWGSSLETPDAGIFDVVHMGTWVAGELPDPNLDLTNQGTAVIYTGHAIGTVTESGGASYLALGGYTQDFNFLTGHGNANFNQFNGHSFSVPVAMSPIPGQAGFFFGSIDSGDMSAGLSGSFFASPTDPVAAVGGNFNYTLPGEMASGVFAGER